MGETNVVFVVLDSFRNDFESEDCPIISELAERGVYFPNAVVPATWSLPSHASILSGEYPSEHATFTSSDRFGELPVVRNFSERGYTTFGVSANSYTSPSYNFASQFDSFVNTNTAERVRGMNVVEESRRIGDGVSLPKRYAKLLWKALTGETLREDLTNLALAVLRMTGRNVEFLQSLHPIFSPFYSSSNGKNTVLVTEFLSDPPSPFFLFTNYMNTHYPYTPPPRKIDEYFEARPGFREIRRINETVGNPHSFTEQYETGNVSTEDVAAVRRLYWAEAATVDEAIGEIQNELEQNGLLADTVLVITSDHGQLLGERDERGVRRKGHVESISDHLTKVPLVISNPEIESRTIERNVPLVNVADFLTDMTLNADEIVERLLPEDGLAVVEDPASYTREPMDTEFDVSEEYIQNIADVHRVTVYDRDWKVVCTSSDGAEAWRGGERRDIDEAPRAAVAKAEDHLRALENVDKSETSDDELPADVARNLRDLGYR